MISQGLRRPVIGSIPQDDQTAYTALQRSTPFVLTAQNIPITSAYHDIVRVLTGGIIQKLKGLSRPQNMKSLSTTSSSGAAPQLRAGHSASPTEKPHRETGLSHTNEVTNSRSLIKEMDLKKDLTSSKGDTAKEKELHSKTQRVITQLADKLGQGIPPRSTQPSD